MYEVPEQPLRELARLEPLRERVRLMTPDQPDPTSPNGIKLVRVVTLDKAADTATLDVYFYNENYLTGANSVLTATNPKNVFPISGGTRIRAGNAAGQVQVSAIAVGDTKDLLRLTLGPIGDYSTYTLSLISKPAWKFDPLFSEIRFKFRPGCFNNNCAPEWDSGQKPRPEPVIDYLAKDYGSFRDTMITAMARRVPEWQPTSEADLDMVLAELFSVAADELSDYQDRVMNEAYLATARKRVSLARHARLMDYHIHEGSQASTWLALEIEPNTKNDFLIGEGLTAWAGTADGKPLAAAPKSAVVFMSRHAAPQKIHHYLNNIGLYTWGNTITGLKAGATRADLQLYRNLYLDGTGAAAKVTSKAGVDEVVKLINDGNAKYLVIQEHLNPETGTPNGLNPEKRQLLTLIVDKAEAVRDTVTGDWMVRVRWEKRDALKYDYCFRVDCPTGIPGLANGSIDNVSMFHGNLVEAFHGRERTDVFYEEGTIFTPDGAGGTVKFLDGKKVVFHYERTHYGEPNRWGVICRLPEVPLAYLQSTPGGDIPPHSTIKLWVSDGAPKVQWNEVPSFIHSDDSSEAGDHFVVETDENRRSIIRFGNGKNGRELPDGAKVKCVYQVGLPLDGNIGRERLNHVDPATVLSREANPGDPVPPAIIIHGCWNPFDVINGIDREPAYEIIRRVPEAYHHRQLRAVTLQDYIDRAEEIAGVSRAAARYMWTGSWRTVRVTIDPEGTTELSYELRKQISDYLNAVRLIGEDLEIRPPQFVPVEIVVVLCARQDVWREDIKFVLEQEFSDGYTPDGRLGFFHPDEWTFGQPLYASQIIGRAMLVDGIEHAVEQKTGTPPGPPTISVSIKRRNSSDPPQESITDIAPNEIILVANDPDHIELGTIRFEVKGGRH